MCLTEIEEIYQIIKKYIKDRNTVFINVSFGDSNLSFFTSILELGLNNDFFTVVLNTKCMDENIMNFFVQDIKRVKIDPEAESFILYFDNVTVFFENQDNFY